MTAMSYPDVQPVPANWKDFLEGEDEDAYEGEPKDANNLASNLLRPSPRKEYDAYYGKLQLMTCFSVGSVLGAGVVRYLLNPSLGWATVVLVITVWSIVGALIAWNYFRHNIISGLNENLVQPVRSIKDETQPWLMVRRLQHTVSLISNNPLKRQQFNLFRAKDRDEAGRPTYNSVAWLYCKLADAAALTIEKSPARESQRSNPQFAGEFDKILLHILERTWKFRDRYTYPAHKLACVNVFIAFMAVWKLLGWSIISLIKQFI
jgi:hypothetical protein